MATIQLNDAERELVRKYLERAHRDLFHEIHRATDREFKTQLKIERDEIEAVLDKLGFPVAAK